MPKYPPCKSLGKYCREIKVTIRISDVESESRTVQEASVTWIAGHTERVTFKKPYVVGTELRADAIVHVPCRFLKTEDGDPAVRPDGSPAASLQEAGARVVCQAHGYTGRLPRSRREPGERPVLRIDEGVFAIFYKGKKRELALKPKRKGRRALPVLESNNPCVGAPCLTSDNVRGAACCRDLQLELHLPKKSRRKEALLRARRAPYLCRVTRDDKKTVSCEIISACGYLADDGVHCVLHDRVLPNGKRAKPRLCYDWPELEPDETGHTGCRLV